MSWHNEHANKFVPEFEENEDLKTLKIEVEDLSSRDLF